MRTTFAALIFLLAAMPALPQPAGVPDLDYVAVAESFVLPAGMNLGAASGVAVNSKGHIRYSMPTARSSGNGCISAHRADW